MTARPNVQPLVDRLSGLGLTHEEAALYVHLTMHGAAKAGDLAAVLGYPRPKAYRLLSSLMHRGFVAATLSRPTVFEAAPPERLFAGLLAATQTRTQVLQAAQAELSPQLAGLRGSRGRDPGRITYKILQGRAETSGVAEAMARDAHDGLVLLDATPPGRFHGTRAAAVQRAAHGLPVRALFAGPVPRRDLDAWSQLASLRLRDVPSGTARFLVADGEALLWLAHDTGDQPDGPRDAALWTDSPDLVQSLQAFFEAAWTHGGAPAPDVSDRELAALGLGTAP